MSISYPNISICGQGTNEGRLEGNGESINWIGRAGDKTSSLPFKNIKAVAFYDFGRSCQLWLTDASGSLHRFDGFRNGDFDRLAAYLSGHGLTLARRELSTKGRNWGSVRLNGGRLELLDDGGKVVAPIPLAQVSQAAMPGKNELEIQFFDDDTVEREDESCIELRLYVPEEHALPGVDMTSAAAAAREKAKARAAKHKARGGGKGGAGGDEEGEEGEADGEADGAGGEGAVSVLHSLLTDAAGIAGVSGEAIAELGEDVGQFLVPRGRYAIELYPTFMRLIGKTYEFKVSYKSVARMFYLDRPSGVTGDRSSRYALVISLDDPIRHGAQRHPHLVMQLERGAEELVVPVHLSEEDRAAGRYEGLCKDGSTELRGEAPKLVAMLLKHVTGKPVFRPGAYMSTLSQKCVRCSLKSNDGLLYPLDKSFLFIHKPTTYIRYGEVDSVEFQRSDISGASAARTFDVAVHCKALGSEPARSYTFQGIDRAEKDVLKSFLEGRQLRVIEALPAKGAGAGKIDFAELDDDEDDEDEDDEDYDASAAKKGGKRGRGGDDDDDDDEEDDDDYGGGGSDDDDDDDDDGGDDDDEDAGFSRKKKKSSSSSSKSKSSSSSKKSSSKSSSSKDKKSKKKRRGSDDDE